MVKSAVVKDEGRDSPATSEGMSSFAAVFFFLPKLSTSFTASSTPPDVAFVLFVAAAITVTFSVAFRPPSSESGFGF
jgi:hypothetical protein